MQLRAYQPGDETVQVEIYNEAAAALPKFKPATVDDVRRRCREPGFDPATRIYAEDAGQIVGYVVFNPDGRVSYPWCRKGREHAAEQLFQRALHTMQKEGLPLAYAVYRGDWPEIAGFFEKQGFRQAREMVNYALELSEMPTRFERPGSVAALRPDDIPALLRIGAGVLRVKKPDELERYLFHNTYFTPDSLFGVRQRQTGQISAVGILIQNPAYADPFAVDAAMPCFRLGAFGTEGTHAKRINGLFSVLTNDDFEGQGLALTLMGHAAQLLEKADMGHMAAQVPSDVPNLARFYKQQFRRQGSFPVYEKPLSP
jgi:GNAT superfamily N-acetyltransferase/ribosomal protein S18 acetylase RimI-like enzyme